MQIKTDSLAVEEPKNPESCNLFSLCKLFFEENELSTIHQHYLQGGLGYGTLKQQLFEKIMDTFKEARDTFNSLINSPEDIHAILENGAKDVKEIAKKILKKLKKQLVFCNVNVYI